jgi:hypothetical protein
MAGILGLISTALFVARHDLGLGPGGIERLAAYTTTTWQIVAGLVFCGLATVVSARSDFA